MFDYGGSSIWGSFLSRQCGRQAGLTSGTFWMLAIRFAPGVLTPCCIIHGSVLCVLNSHPLSFWPSPLTQIAITWRLCRLGGGEKTSFLFHYPQRRPINSAAYIMSPFRACWHPPPSPLSSHTYTNYSSLDSIELHLKPQRTLSSVTGLEGSIAQLQWLEFFLPWKTCQQVFQPQIADTTQRPDIVIFSRSNQRKQSLVPCFLWMTVVPLAT